MKIKCLFFIIHLTLIFNVNNVLALDGISFGAGPVGSNKIKSLHFGIEKNWHKQWFNNCAWRLTGYWDLGFYRMYRSAGDDLGGNNKLIAITMSPVFRLYKNEDILKNKEIYIDIGIGVAQLNKKTIGKRELGSNFQFEDRLGIGLRFGDKKQYDINYRVIHFSNAYLNSKNNGINLHLLSINYWFM